MVLPWALAVLSLLPLLSAQRPECANLTANSITNATLDWISGKWFYVAAIYRGAEANQAARTVAAATFYYMPNKTEDKIYLREYLTIADHCHYSDVLLLVHRQNGTFSKDENGTVFYAHLLQTKTPGILMMSKYPDDKQNMQLVIFSRKPQLNKEQTKEFHKALGCMGMDKSEIISTDEKKDKCGPLEKQHEEERKKEQGGANKDSTKG